MRDNQISAHFIHALKTKGYSAIGVNVFHYTLMRFHFTKRDNSVPVILLGLFGRILSQRSSFMASCLMFLALSELCRHINAKATEG